MPQLILGKLDVHLGRSWVQVAKRLLHHMQRGALRDQLGAARVPQLMHRVQGLAVDVALAGHRPLHYLANPREHVPVERSATLIETVPTALIQHQSPWFARTTIQLT